MLFLKDYTVSKKIHAGRQTTIYQALNKQNNTPVVIKCIKPEMVTAEQVARLKREYELMKMLNEDGTVAAYNFISDENDYAIIMEAFSNQSLKEYLTEYTPLSIEAFLTLALKITEALECIHDHHIVHKDINPTNILWNAKKSQIKIIDFGIASTLSREEALIQNLQRLEGSLPYISPEQTGRINRGIDYRTDYYSLGVVFYEMITGKLPFDSEDIMEILHDHIAREPVPPKEIRPEIPDVISDIILKLMSKAGEDRYQSSFGLKSDLKKCLEEWKQEGRIKSFPLGTHDISTYFHVPEKLYGRQEESQLLFDTFYRVSTNGICELMLVTGYSGVGKSRLVHSVRPEIDAKHGYFVTGKFDQYKRNIPYYALIQAFQGLVKQILVENVKHIEEWRKRLLECLGINGQVVLDVIPELESIIGPQPSVQKLGLTETQNRFNIVFQDFIRVLASKDQPLLMFIDDLQWADTPSLKILESLLTNLDNRYISIIGAYRENEVDATHPLFIMLNNLNKIGTKVTTLVLKPLKLEHVEELLCETLHKTIIEVKELAKVCYDKTHGNPFFLLQFLQELYREQLIEFNLKEGIWIANIQGIEKKKYTDNVVDFMTHKVLDLPLATQQALQLASCLGNRFDLQTLSVICQKSPNQIASDLSIALQEGLIIPTNDAYKIINEDYSPQVYYIFLHDRIQQAAYSLIDNKDKNRIHLNIGRLLLENSTDETLSENLLDIVNHLNEGILLVTNEDERLKIIKLNLRAAQKARQSIAYKASLNYLKKGISLLELDIAKWDRHYELCLSLYTEAFETSYLASEFPEMEMYGEILFQHARTIEDKIKVYETKINYLSSQNRFSDALQLALKALALYDIKFPKNPNLFDAILTLMKIKWILRGKSLEDLANLPELTDPKWQSVMRILASAGTVAYLGHPYFVVFFIYELIRLTVKYGMAPQSPIGYIGYATMLCTILKDADLGYQFGQLAIRIVDQRNFERQKPQVYMAFCDVISIWKVHLDDIIPILVNTFQQGINVGDLENTGFKASGYVSFLFSTGKNLNTVIEEGQKYGKYLLKFGQITSYKYLLVFWVIALYLVGKNTEQIRAAGAFYDEEKMIAEGIATKDSSALAEFYFVRIICNYFNENYESALLAAQEADRYLEGPVETQTIAPLTYLYSSLTFTACYPSASHTLQKKYLSYVKKYLKKMKFRSKQAPMNYLHKYYLMLGAYYNVTGSFDKAIKYFDLSIQYARENGYVNEEAIANELAAKAFLSKGNEKIARVYIYEAHYCYSLWGALIKVKQIEEKYGYLLMREVRAIGINQAISTVTETNHIEKANETLDLATIIKSAQTISKEIILGNLLQEMMHIVIENAGAQKGSLILEKEGHWYIEAEGTMNNEAKVLQSIPFAESLPVSIINYVIRTKKALVIDDVMHDTNFSKDPYVKSEKPKSILCMPLLNKGALSGILYLENKLAIKVFTQERLDLLNLLSGQIVISIDNARLYTHTIALNKDLSNVNKSLIDLNKAYARFVPQQFLNLLEKQSITDVSEGDQIQKDMTILFSDIRNFTKLSEKMTPAENFYFVNEFLHHIEPQISAHHGFVDKYFGDGIMALFSTSADDALKSAIAMLDALSHYNIIRKNEGKDEIAIGIGLNSGKLMLGTVGAEDRMDVTVISDAVNLASRIEHVTKIYHTPLLITEEVYHRLKQPSIYSIRKIGLTAIRGKAQMITIYEVFDADSLSVKTLKQQNIEQFEQAVSLFHKQYYIESRAIFQDITKENKYDFPAAIYLKRCDKILKQYPLLQKNNVGS